MSSNFQGFSALPDSLETFKAWTSSFLNNIITSLVGTSKVNIRRTRNDGFPPTPWNIKAVIVPLSRNIEKYFSRSDLSEFKLFALLGGERNDHFYSGSFNGSKCGSKTSQVQNFSRDE
ncbi:unnamed protein product [Nesidiocoris tenuis]|uniref:Uncharacterized protein n=1 Tax=Nesidiocoris tenuis TaxID=355587 RepID=A0A6H5G0H6_9HEMI|nr:unnamed protein product [Nesidiocoris tenuis]